MKGSVTYGWLVISDIALFYFRDDAISFRFDAARWVVLLFRCKRIVTYCLLNRNIVAMSPCFPVLALDRIVTESPIVSVFPLLLMKSGCPCCCLSP